MIKLSAAEIITATGGSPLGLAGRESELGATFATTDSREAIPGTLFVAKPGEVTDGHNFVSGAFDKGAVLALVERPVKMSGVFCTPASRLMMWFSPWVRSHSMLLKRCGL